VSPVDIKVTDQNGNTLGMDNDGGVRYEIPGAGFEIIDGHKYVYLPLDENQTYNIDLKGNGAGTFTLIKKEIGGEQAAPAVVFNDIPVTPEFNARLDVSGAEAKIITDAGQEILPTANVPFESSGDNVPPQTAVAVNGEAAKDFYNTDAGISLSAADFAPDSAMPAGVFSISYRLDGNATSTAPGATTTIAVSGEGKHTLVFSASDKLGNKEKLKSIGFTIDKTAPELKFNFGQTQKDLVFFAVDNFSAPEIISIADQGGTVAATDEAGNITKLSFFEKDRKQSLRAQLAGLSYNGKTIDISGNRISFAWFYGYAPRIPLALTGLQPLPAIPATLPKTGTLSFLLQQAKLKDGSFIVALYAKGKTLILERKDKKLNLKSVIGLKILNFTTDKGALSWNY
jgi:hypothetical protein